MQNTMLGKQSGVCSSDSWSSGGTSGVTFDSTKHDFRSNNTDSEGSEFSVSNNFLGDRSTPVYNHSLSFPLSDVTCTGNSLSLFENTSSTDFLCDDLPEIGSFEDVDRMFRRSDSTFGLVDSEEDEFGWLSSEYDKGEALQSDFGFPCHETSMRANVSENYGSSKCYTELSDAPIWIKDGSCAWEKSDSYTSFVNGLGIGDRRHGFVPEEQQMNDCKNQLKHMEKKRKEHNFGNGSNSYLGNLSYELNQFSSGTSLQGYPSAHMSQQLRPTGPDSFFYLQNNGSQPYSDNSQLSDQASVTFADSTTLAPWVTSHPSNQMQFMGNSHDPQSLLTATSGTDNAADIHTFQSNLSSQSASLMEQTSLQDPGLVGKQVKLCGDKFENPTDAGGVSLVIPVEPGSSNVQESSMMNMGVDDISLAAASFCQLQLVTEWLDLRTKLCIRDGLYRLARGAEQRINRANLRGNSSGGSFMAEETNKYTICYIFYSVYSAKLNTFLPVYSTSVVIGILLIPCSCTSLINMETGTNPIDRSIAQLLFHRPSGSLVTFAHDV